MRCSSRRSRATARRRAAASAARSAAASAATASYSAATAAVIRLTTTVLAPASRGRPCHSVASPPCSVTSSATHSSCSRVRGAAGRARAAGYGFTAVLLGALLAARGYSRVQVGVVLTALIAGTALASLAVGRFGDQFGRRRSYAVFFGGIAAAGVVVAAGAPLWVLLVVALPGPLSTHLVHHRPATTLEQAVPGAEKAGTA